jgi:hypothetical protein
MMITEEGSKEVYEEYSGTLSRKDQMLIQNKFKANKNFNFLKFMHNFNGDEQKQTHLNIEVKLNDFINEKINVEIIEKSILNYKVSRKMSDIIEMVEVDDYPEIYDPVYLLSNFYALLHYGK